MLVTGGGTQRDGYDGAFAVRDGRTVVAGNGNVADAVRACSCRGFIIRARCCCLTPACSIAGGGNDGPAVNYTRGEIFSPPYLFKGPRPTITAAPTETQYGSTFVVDTPDAASYHRRLADPSRRRHARVRRRSAVPESDVRRARSGRLRRARRRQNANLAPPGYYMLFLVAGDVPSTAAFVRLPSPADDTTPPTAPANADGHAGCRHRDPELDGID